MNKFELNFCQDRKNWKRSLNPEINKNESYTFVDLLVYGNQFALFKKVHVLFGNHHETLICRGCLNYYTSENMLIIHKPKYEQQEKTNIRALSEPQLQRKKHFHMNILYFGVYADFEADNGIDKSNIGNKTTNIYKQNPECNGFFILSLLEVVLKRGCFESLTGYNIVDWFVNEVINLVKNGFLF